NGYKIATYQPKEIPFINNGTNRPENTINKNAGLYDAGQTQTNELSSAKAPPSYGYSSSTGKVGDKSGSRIQTGNLSSTGSNIPSYVDTSKMSAFEKSLAEVLYGSGGTPLVNAPYIKNGLPNGRPTVSASEKLKFETVVYNNQITANGKLYDPNTENLLNWKPGDSRKGVVDFGHTQGNPYQDMFLRYKYKEINLEQLKEFQKNPKNFQIEIPSSNRSNKHTK
ncbi:GH-E family nuclease, partial [Fusobacterium sp. PH5-44]|uniref:GH-E family nuclease n=1 Tax=unclassified Fusobacterium TaxID=2648384 RepID=UPI003D2121A8